ncbi:MAG: hypothetical protein J6V39_03220, partial [Clostridia bacterium]|nr:hypothetical protein [Clostridia bacterium]
ADEAATLTVTWQTPPTEVLVRPLSRGVQVRLDGCTASFTLPGCGQYTVEADGWHGALHVFVNPIKQTDGLRTTYRFAGGEHHIGSIELTDNDTVYIDAGAVVYGSFYAICAENIRILGNGIIDGSKEERTSETSLLAYDYEKPVPQDKQGIRAFLHARRVLRGNLRFYRCKNVSIEGVVCRDSASFSIIAAGCENVSIENVKCIGMWRYNSDGIDLFNCTGVSVRNCFLRNFDDCMVIKGICGWDDVPNRNITVEGCVLWCDWGRALEIGAETNAPAFYHIVFSDCDVIHGSTMQLDIQHHNRAEIHHVTFENIRVEYTQHQLSDLGQQSDEQEYQNTDPVRHPILLNVALYDMGLFAKDGKHGCVHDILFRDIYVLTDAPMPMPMSIFAGLDEQHSVKDVRIEGLYFNKERVTDANANFVIGAHAYNISLS